MDIFDPKTGRFFVRKLRKRREDSGDGRELTFTCYHRYRFLGRDRTRQWFVEALQEARQKWPFDVWAYVLMPEHVHLIVSPRKVGVPISGFLGAIKDPVGRKAIAFLKRSAPEWLPRLTVREGNRVRHRFWQPGGGYDRNLIEPATLQSAIDYIHANPVRRGLAQRPEDWEWSSARWYAGIRPVPIEMDRTIPYDGI